MKYHNFKRSLAIIMATLLTFSSASFVATAEETAETPDVVTYTLRGGSSNGDGTGNYVVDVLANGGKINTGYVELTYDSTIYSSATFTPAAKIKDVSDYWTAKNEAGTIGVGFMSAAGLSDDDIELFADIENPSTNIAYIDASGTDLVKIGTFTFTFAEGKTYDTAFTTANAEASKAKVAQAKYVLHSPSGYNTDKLDAEKSISNTLVFSAGDFTVTNNNVGYIANTAQKPDVDSSVATAFNTVLGDNDATEVINAGEYVIKVTGVEGEGYYDATEITLTEKFTIAEGSETINKPDDPADITYMDKLPTIDKWEITAITNKINGDAVDSSKTLDVGTYTLSIKYTPELDENINYSYGEGVTNTEGTITSSVSLKVIPSVVAENAYPNEIEEYSDVYDSAIANQTIAGYEIAAEEDWKWVRTDISISTTKPDAPNAQVYREVTDDNNYDYSNVPGYDAVTHRIVRNVTVYLTKAPGVAPAAPVVDTEDKRRDSLTHVIKASDLVTNAGEWSYNDAAELTTGDNTIAFTYKPDDLDNVDYEGLANWNAETEQFEYSVTVKVLAPYFDPTGIYPPTNPTAVNFEEGKTFTAADFALANDWEYGETFELTSAGTKTVKVLYTIPGGYDGIDSTKYDYTVEDGKIVSSVVVTVNKIDIPDGAITFSQETVYTGSAIELDTANITVTGLTGVDADNVKLEALAAVDVNTYDVYATVDETTNYNAKDKFVIGTLTITPADVTVGKFTITTPNIEYNGNVQTPSIDVDANIGAPTYKYYDAEGNEVEPKNYGTYTVKASGAAKGNYKAYADLEIGTFNITKHQITINKPSDPTAVDYVAGGFDVKTLTFTDWTVTDTAALNAGTHTVNIKYTSALDTENNTYLAGEGVTKTGNEFTATVSLTVNKIAGTVTAPTATQTVTFDPKKGDKMASTYATFADGWSIAVDKALTYGANAITVEHAADTLNYTWDGYTVVGEEAINGKITKVVDVTFEQKEIATTVPPVLVEGTNNKTFIEAGYKYSDFEIATADWVYDTPDAEIKSATTVNAKVKYAIGADYKLPEGSTWTREGDYIVAEIALTVVPAELPADAAVATDTTATYDGSAKSVIVSKKEGYTELGSFTVTYKKDGSEDPAAAEVTNAGTYDVIVTFADGTNYKGGTIELDKCLVINKANVEETDFTVSDKSQTYDGSKKAPTVAKVTEGIGDPAITIDEVINVGKYTFTVSGPESTNYNAYSFNYENGFEITAAELKAGDFTVEAGDYTFDNTAKKPNVTTALAGVGTITVTYKQNGEVVTAPTNAGTYDVFVTVEAGTNYAALGETNVGSFEIKKATLDTSKITFAQTAIYNGSAVALDNSKINVDAALIGVTAADVTIALKDATEAVNANTYAVVATVKATTNYAAVEEAFEIGSLVIDKAAVKETDFTVSDKSLPYDGSKKAPKVEKVTEGIGDPTITMDDAIAVGKYTFTVSGPESENYNSYTFEYENGFEITAAELKAGDFTVEAGDYTFDNTAKKPNVTTALAGVGTITVTYKQNGEVVADPTNAGTYDVYVTVEAGTNYAALGETKVDSFEIKKATLDTSKITFAQTAIYNGSAVALDNSKINVDASLIGVTAADVTIALKDATEAVNANTYAVVATVKATTNYAAVEEAFEIGSLVIARANVTEDMFTVTNNEHKYDGTAKEVNVAVKTEYSEIGAPTVTYNPVEVKAVGEYVIHVKGDATTNYEAYEFDFVNTKLKITAGTLTKDNFKVETVDYTYTKDTAQKAGIEYVNVNEEDLGEVTITYKQNGTVVENPTDAGTYEVYVAVAGNTNYEVFAEELIGSYVIEQATGTIPALTTSYEATYNKDIADKKVTSYITIADAKWTLTNADAVLEYKADNKYEVTTVLDTKNYTYAAVEGVTVGDGKATAEITVKFNKATLPTDAAKATTKTTEYTGSGIEVEVLKNDAYDGLGEFTVAYPEGNINVGTYDVTATFADGENYLGGTVTLADVLTITKQVVESIEVPEVPSEAIVGTEFKDATNVAGWSYTDITIGEGTNNVTVTKTIEAATAKNYDYTTAAEAAGVTVNTAEDGTVTLTKTYTVTGKYETGKVSLTINTNCAGTGDVTANDVTITITPKNGTAYTLDAAKFTESGSAITIKDLVLNVGDYTITVKKMKYLECVINLTVKANATVEKNDIALIAGDIVGGPKDSETIGDKVIDIDDFIIAIRAFDEATSAEVKTAADIDESGFAGVADLGFIKTNFNKTTAKEATITIE